MTNETFAASIDPRPEDAEELAAILDTLDDGARDLACEWGNEAECRADNNQRAGFAARAVIAYADRVFNGNLGNEDLATVLGDLLGDLHHLCDLAGLDFDRLNNGAMPNYIAELHGTF